uniref:Peptidase M14 domain-containing protein n=1 Tax=Ciona savignyi TaxID=51511 RepID=H2YZ90_CIOSA
MLEILINISRACPNVSKVYSIGSSTAGRSLWVIEFSDNPGVHEVGEPEFRYLANVHGNEVTGREMTLRFAKHLCYGYLMKETRILNMIQSTRIHIMPSMNPDGFDIASRNARRGRFNYNGIDLNRDFPDLTPTVQPYLSNSVKKQATCLKFGLIRNFFGNILNLTAIYFHQAVLNWLHAIPFVMSYTFHDGAVGVVYPFDKRPKGRWYGSTPDDNLFRALASNYAQKHRHMSDKSKFGIDHNCRYTNGDFHRLGGIVNGAAWYSITGALEDYSYIGTDCFGLAVELSCTKWVSTRRLRKEWLDNKDAMLSAVENVHIGIKGVVRYRLTGEPIKDAVVHVLGQEKDVSTSRDGDYWRPLQRGIYTV